MILASQTQDDWVNFHRIHMLCPLSKGSRYVSSGTGTDDEHVARIVNHLVREVVRAECVVVRPIIWISPNEIGREIDCLLMIIVVNFKHVSFGCLPARRGRKSTKI